MRIKKVSQTTPTIAQIVDGYSTSTTNGYSANYINNNIKSSVTELLATSQSGTNISATLNSAYTNYDFLLITWSPYSTTENVDTWYVPTSIINSSRQFELTHFQNTGVFKTIQVSFSNTTSMSFNTSHSGTWDQSKTQLISIKGIKL